MPQIKQNDACRLDNVLSYLKKQEQALYMECKHVGLLDKLIDISAAIVIIDAARYKVWFESKGN